MWNVTYTLSSVCGSRDVRKTTSTGFIKEENPIQEYFKLKDWIENDRFL